MKFKVYEELEICLTPKYILIKYLLILKKKNAT